MMNNNGPKGDRTLARQRSSEANRGNHHAKPGRSGPPDNKNAVSHGYYSLVALLRKSRGVLDKQTALGRMVEKIKAQLERDLGSDLSTAQKMIVHDIAVNSLLLRALDNALGDTELVVDDISGPKPHPIFAIRAGVIKQRFELLKAIGLERKQKEVTLDEIIASMEPEEAEMSPESTDRGPEGPEDQ